MAKSWNKTIVAPMMRYRKQLELHVVSDHHIPPQIRTREVTSDSDDSDPNDSHDIVHWYRAVADTTSTTSIGDAVEASRCMVSSCI